MSRPRSEFKALLDSVAASVVEEHNDISKVSVYGQAPGNDGLEYPCIIYKEDFEAVDRADNLPYNITDRYSVTIIERDPTRPVAKAVRELEQCTFNRRFEAEDLIHTVYNIYF